MATGERYYEESMAPQPGTARYRDRVDRDIPEEDSVAGRGGYPWGDERGPEDLPEMKRELLILAEAVEGVVVKLESLTRHLESVTDRERVQKFLAEAHKALSDPQRLETRTEVGLVLREFSQRLNRVQEQLDVVEMAVSL